MGELLPELQEGTKTWISRSRNEVNLEEVVFVDSIAVVKDSFFSVRSNFGERWNANSSRFIREAHRSLMYGSIQIRHCDLRIWEIGNESTKRKKWRMSTFQVRLCWSFLKLNPLSNIMGNLRVESTPRSLLEGDPLLEAYLYPEVFSYVVRRDTPTKVRT